MRDVASWMTVAQSHISILRGLLVVVCFMCSIPGQAGASSNPFGALLDGLGGGAAKKCKPFRCAGKGRVPVMLPMPKLHANGCGAGGIRVGAGDFNFTRCCDFHDACYGVCGVRMDYCENAFSACLRAYCGEQPRGKKRRQCEGVAELFTMTTGVMGCEFFEEGQSDMCECVDRTEAPGRRSSALMALTGGMDGLAKLGILGEKGKGQSSALSKLVEKHKSVRSFADLYYRAVRAAYPGKSLLFFSYLLFLGETKADADSLFCCFLSFSPLIPTLPDSLDIQDPRRGFIEKSPKSSVGSSKGSVAPSTHKDDL